VIRDLGAQVWEEGASLVILGGGRPRSGHLDCGESGFCLRAAAAVAALEDRPMTLAGRGSLLTRPMDMLLEPLRQLGVACATQGGLPPLELTGPLQGGRATVDGRASSQFLSGLLLALPRAPLDSVLEVEGLRSAPYIRMTLDVLEAFGVRVEASAALDRFAIPGRQVYRPVDLGVEGDWSGAAFLLVAGAVAGEVAVAGLNPASAQADRAVLEALAAEIQKSLGSKGAGAITIPGLVKIEKKKVPARPAQKGVPNPFKPGELMDRPAKPAYNKVKVRALKLLKDMAK